MSRVYRVDQSSPDPQIVRLAADVLCAGGVVVFPTETVYGIAVTTMREGGPDPVFLIKRRKRSQTLPWLVGGSEALDVYAREVPEYAYRLARAFWPGALTLVVRASDAVPPAFAAQDATIALRAPDNALCQALITACGTPLATTSANTHDMPSPTSADTLEPRIASAASVVLDGGETTVGVASTIVSCIGSEPVVLRVGALSEAELLGAL